MKLRFKRIKSLFLKGEGKKSERKNSLRKIMIKGSVVSLAVGLLGLSFAGIWAYHVSSVSNKPVVNYENRGLEGQKRQEQQEQLPEQGQKVNEAGPEIEVDKLAEITQETEKKLTIEDFSFPIPGEPSKGVGNYYSEELNAYLFHAGVDYELEEGYVVKARQGGVVTYAGEDVLLGQKVTIDCGQGWEIVYGGLDQLRVKAGDKVEEGDVLGQVGAYPGIEGGKSHIHYEVWLNDTVMNPLEITSNRVNKSN